MSNMNRRRFLEGSAAAVGISALGCGRDEKQPRSPHPAQWWEDGQYVDHKAVNTRRLADGVIRARVDGQWRDFQVVQLPDAFVHWSFQMRIERLKKLAQYGFSTEDLDGPHNACVATYGGWKRDSSVSLNTAYKIGRAHV